MDLPSVKTVFYNYNNLKAIYLVLMILLWTQKKIKPAQTIVCNIAQWPLFVNWNVMQVPL